jgi:signal transduction histidine kinase
VHIRPSTVAVVLAAVLVFTGLTVAETSLGESEAASREAEAQEIAAVARTFVQTRVAALHTLDGLYLDADVSAPDNERFARLTRIGRSQLESFERVWITDGAGVLMHETPFSSPRAQLPVGADLDTLDVLGLRALAAQARRTGRVAVSGRVTLLDGEPGLVLLEPVMMDGVLRGFVGGTVRLVLLREQIRQRRPIPSQLGIVLTTSLGDGDTIVVQTEPGFERASRSPRVVEPVPLPSGGTWYLGVYHEKLSAVRVQLWGVALAAMAALIVGAWHERRQTRRIADRSRELEHLSQELLRANKAKSEFLANVSHELRTPLNAVVGFTELLRDGVYGELTPRQAGPVQRIEASAAHLRGLVDQVLDLARMAAGRLEVHRELVDLRQVVLDTATEMEPLLAERRLTFSMSLGPQVPRVRTDPTHLRQILVNLLGNALKFTDSGGITVRTRVVTGALTGPGAEAPRPEGTWVTLQVIDTGIGIAPQDHERIFDEFEQVNAGARADSDHRGTGLGLPISRRLARLLGGDLRVESDTGRGSTFTVWLPVE